jgi:hypothetical protein
VLPGVLEAHQAEQQRQRERLAAAEDRAREEREEHEVGDDRGQADRLEVHEAVDREGQVPAEHLGEVEPPVAPCEPPENGSDASCAPVEGGVCELQVVVRDQPDVQQREEKLDRDQREQRQQGEANAPV